MTSYVQKYPAESICLYSPVNRHIYYTLQMKVERQTRYNDNDFIPLRDVNQLRIIRLFLRDRENLSELFQ